MFPWSIQHNFLIIIKYEQFNHGDHKLCTTAVQITGVFVKIWVYMSVDEGVKLPRLS